MRKLALMLSTFAVDAWAAPPMGDAPLALMSVTPIEESVEILTPDLLEEKIKKLTVEQGFFVLEQSLNAELDYAQSIENSALIQRKMKKLSAFYAANELHVEALAVLDELDEVDDQARFLAAKSHYALGRYEAVLSLYTDISELASTPAVLIAKVKARLGVYDDAYRFFSTDTKSKRDADYLLLSAEAAAAVGDISQAKAALDESAQYDRDETQELIRQYLAASVSASQKKSLKLVVQSKQEPWASKAALQLLKHEITNQPVPEERVMSDLEGLYLRSDDPSFRREIAMIRADIFKNKGDVIAEVASLRRVVDEHPYSDQAAAAALKIRSVLVSLSGTESELLAIESAQLFYENIAYAPPGEEGDVLIRNVADRLVNLDLSDNAAELIEHQVFNRLRGFKRSRVAADLAEIYLASRKPEEALRVLRSTRIAGLAKDVNDRRRLLEARALDAAGKTEAALNLLNTVGSVDEKLLEANIYWRIAAWDKAGVAYREMLTIAPKEISGEPFMRAAVAFALDDNNKALNQLLAEYRESLGGSAEYRLAQSLLDDLPTEQAALSVSVFMQAYQEKYQTMKIGG